jgi:2-dehydropantoate 2-reductase
MGIYMNASKKIIIYGAGAIGTSVAAWLAPVYPQLFLLARGDHARAIKSNGCAIYRRSGPKSTVPINVIEDLAEQPDAEIVIITVKNYDLEAAAQDIKVKHPVEALILGFQNGVENQTVLPKYFQKVIYGVVSYNAWRDEPGVIGYYSKGPVILGTLNNELQAELREIKSILGQVMSVTVSSHIQGVAYNKLILNLSNAIMGLLGQRSRTFRDVDKVRRIMIGVITEGNRVLHQAGIRPKSGGILPPIWVMLLLFKMPGFLSNRLFRTFFGGPGISSMAQDLWIKRQSQTEIDTLTGFIVDLAKAHNLNAPLNEKILDLCKSKFSDPNFQPIDENDLYEILFPTRPA